MDAGQLTNRHKGSASGRVLILPDFKKAMEMVDVAAGSLDVSEVEPNLHEKAEGITCRPIYRISWRKEPIRLFGRWTVPRTARGSGRFVRVLPSRIRMPPNIHQQYELADNSPEVEETAVFISTNLKDSRIHAMLAMRIKDHWLKLQRWSASWMESGLPRLDICSF